MESQAEAYDEGSTFERNVYLFLIIWGLITLLRRGVRLSEVIKENKWLCVFFTYWLMSVIWSDMPFVALKRWVKDVGNIVMALVILTEDDPISASKAVFIRCACLLVPLSVLFIRYYSNLGRAYHIATGEMMYTGVATHKNTLGIMVMVCSLFLAWDFKTRYKTKLGVFQCLNGIPEIILMGMTLWLLHESHSATALACTIVGLVLLFTLPMQVVRTRMARVEVYAIAAALLLWLLNSQLGLASFVVQDVLGRDMTLTTRTEVWPVLLDHAANPVVGAGFNSYWSGKRLEVLYEQFSIIQAHNGYLETYLNGGWIAVTLLLILILSSSANIKKEIVLGLDYAIVRWLLLVIAIIHNFTEASFNRGGLLWFAFLLAVTRHPSMLPPTLIGKKVDDEWANKTIGSPFGVTSGMTTGREMARGGLLWVS